MADEDEIDVLGDFSFNSCLAQNTQGIPSCSTREDTVHPQWLLDSVSANWYDTQRRGPSRRLTGNSGKERYRASERTSWSERERQLLVREMEKYGRNVRKISQTIKSKTEAEIQALIEAEHGVHLDTPSFGLRHQESDDTLTVAHEEIVTEEVNINEVLTLVTTASPTVPQINNFKVYSKNVFNPKLNKNSLLKPNLILNKPNLLINKDILQIDSVVTDSSQILYEDELMIGSTQLIGSDADPVDTMIKKMAKQQKAKVKKLGNHRRKVSRNFDGGKRNKSKELKSPGTPGRQRKDSSVSDDSTKSPKMQIVLGSGQALPVSEGEQVIKIEKKQGSESESDIEIDIDSDKETDSRGDSEKTNKTRVQETDKGASEEDIPIAVPLKFERMPRRQKKINLDGDGGYTIMHTPAGDLMSRGTEPKRERSHRPRAVPLIRCKRYSKDVPAPLEVHLSLSTLLAMDAHAHSSRAEVMGLVGGTVSSGGTRQVALTAYKAASAAAGRTHCDMDPDLLTTMSFNNPDIVNRTRILLAMDAHAHSSRAEVMGLVGGTIRATTSPPPMDLSQQLVIRTKSREMLSRAPSLSQASAAEHLSSLGLSVMAWHHSHPLFPPEPSALDLVTQRTLQRALERDCRPLLGIITSQHWPPVPSADQYRCIRIENPEDECEVPTGYQFSVKLVPDITVDNLDAFLDELHTLLRGSDHSEYSVQVETDQCPQAKCTYLEKFILSASRHLKSAGYTADEGLGKILLRRIRDVFR